MPRDAKVPPNLFDEMRKLVGIDGFTTTTPPIGGKIKQDIADFIVQEIMPNGEVLSTWETYNPDIPFGDRNRVTRFTLIKKNTDTIYAAEILRDYLGVPLADIKWAGIKDHTAISSQRFSVRGDHMEKLRRFRHPNITITHILPSRDDMELGKLWGNKFTINIREVAKPVPELMPVLEEWGAQIEEKGFPNFFGMQRFGQHRPNSHIVGKAIFQREYQAAVEEFLFTVYPLEYDFIAKFRREMRDHVGEPGWWEQIPKSLHYERVILQALEKRPHDYKQALLALPPSLTNLLLSSFQSFLFNNVVSARLKATGSLIKPVEGDVVSILKDARGQPSLVFYRYHGGDGWNDANIVKAFQHDRAAIVAPILGYKTELDQFPYFKQMYEELLAREGFPLAHFQHHIPSLFSFEGTFRSIFNRPSALAVGQAYKINGYPELDPHGVKLEFSLPKGTYATMLLAELRKHSEDLE